MNPALCMSLAKNYLTSSVPTTYHYIAVEDGSQCFAATAMPTSLATMTGAKACTSVCVGPKPTLAGATGVLYCGGRNQCDLYASLRGTTASPATPNALVPVSLVAVAVAVPASVVKHHDDHSK